MGYNEDALKRATQSQQNVNDAITASSNLHQQQISGGGMLSVPKSNSTFMLPEFSANSFAGTYVAPPAAASSGGGGGSVICTKFYKLGLCEKEIYYCEHKWGGWLLKNDPFVMHGYYLWGVPLAKQLNRKTWYGRLLIKALHPVFNACSLETAAQQGVYRERSLFTKLLGKFTINVILLRMNRTLGKIRYSLEGRENVARV
jgi:hypothetical protein